MTGLLVLGLALVRADWSSVATRYKTMPARCALYRDAADMLDWLRIDCLFFRAAARVTADSFSGCPGLGSAQEAFRRGPTQRFLKRLNERLFARNLLVLEQVLESDGRVVDGHRLRTGMELDDYILKSEQEIAGDELDRLSSNERDVVCKGISSYLNALADGGRLIRTDVYLDRARATLRRTSDKPRLRLNYGLMEHRMSIAHSLVDQLRLNSYRQRL